MDNSSVFPASVLRFGVFELDCHAGELRKSGVLVHIPPQPFKVLALLTSQPGKVVAREDICQQIWGENTFVDFEQGLGHCIRQIRTALGDNAETPRYIETLPRRGYRFIYPVTTASVAATLPSQAAVPLVGRHKETLFIGLAAAVVIVGILAYWMRPRLPAPRVSGYVRLTHDAVLKYMVGTDGPSIYLGENVPSSGAQLAQVSVAGGDVVSLPTPSANTDPITVSPDGSKVLATERSGNLGDGPLWALPTLGGSPRRLAGIVGHSGTWSPDGRKLVYGNGNNLYLANADGTDAHKLASLPGPGYDLAWSPNAREIRFSLATSGTRPVAIWQVSAEGTRLHEFLPGWNTSATKCCGRWTPDGNYFIFESDGQIWARRETGSILHKVSHAPVQLTNGPLAYLSVRPSRDGKRLFAVEGVARGELNRYDRKTRAFVPYLSGTSAQDVAFSRDGKWVAYVSYPEGMLWRARLDGTDKIQLTFPPIYAALPRWSPDGKEIVFSDLGGTRPSLASMTKPSRICLVPADGGKPRELVPNHSHSQIDTTWSPDGKSIAFYLDLGTPDSDIRILDMKTQQVSTLPGSRGFFSPRWSPDGRYIAAMKRDAQSLWVYDFKTGKWLLVAKVSAGYPCWSRNGRYVYFLHRTTSPAIMRVGIRDRKVERVVSMKDFKTTGYWGIWLGLAPDDAPLVLKDAGTEEAVSMDFVAP